MAAPILFWAMRIRRICQQSQKTSHAADATAPVTTANRKKTVMAISRANRLPKTRSSRSRNGKNAKSKKKVNREIQEAKRGFVIRQKQR